MTIDLVDLHLKVRLLDNLKFDNFEDVLPKLLKYFSKNKIVDWSKPNYRITYNNIKIFEIIGFDIKLNQIKNKTKAEIKLKYENDNIKISAKILIKLQDFFQYKVVEYLKKESEINEKIKHFFNRRFLIDNNEFEVSTDDIRYNVKENSDSESEITLIDNKELAIEEWNYCDYNNYRVDMLLHISGKYYLCLEFFENHHKNPNEVDLSNELHRIMSLVYNNKSRTKKIIHVGIFWESNINNETKFNKFMKEVVIDKIEKYYNIDNEKEYIINAISKELDCKKEFAEILYDATENWNKPTIWINKFINIIVNWKKGKEEECKTKVLNKFIKKINQFKESQNDDIDIQENIIESTGGTFNDNEKKLEDNKKIYYDTKTDRLTNYGLTLYISYLITSNVLNSPDDEEWWNEFNAKITSGFIKGLKKIRNDSLMLTDNFMTGLWDCY
jgi:hypothetical protein